MLNVAMLTALGKGAELKLRRGTALLKALSRPDIQVLAAAQAPGQRASGHPCSRAAPGANPEAN